jgi:nitroreductase
MKNSTGAEIKTDSSGEYQERYMAHQSLPGGKRDELIALMKERHSNRRYGDAPVQQELLDSILDLCRHAPSSCDRFGTRIKIIRDRDDKALLNGLLVGGTGWCYRAPVILMLFADTRAYVGGDNGDEVNYNSLLDAGVMAQQIMLVATANGLHTAFINPQVRKANQEFFYSRFAPKGWDKALFCGAVAIGHPHPEPIKKVRRLIESVVVE